MNTWNVKNRLSDTIDFNRNLSITNLKTDTDELAKEQYNQMEGLCSEISVTVRKAERDVRILNRRMAKVDKSSPKYKSYESRLNKVKSLLTELKTTAEEMNAATFNQMVTVHYFRNTMDKAEKNMHNIITDYSKGNFSLDEMQVKLNNLKNNTMNHMEKLLPYKKVNELIGGKVASGLELFNEHSKKISLIYKDSMASLCKRIDTITEIVKFYEEQSDIVVPEAQLTGTEVFLEQMDVEGNVPLELELTQVEGNHSRLSTELASADVLNQQMSEFESGHNGTSVFTGKQVDQSITRQQYSCVGICRVMH
ncbi:hypothetical protein AB7179_20780 [Providencia manganoxydans]|uniref:Uncharacterized protein n=1 Tax=Providencia manganoxydans TaxID=2923283 RepID=A0ABX7AEQ7_9GAMM|nr:hypothetical protein JI723_18585 [Providencia manganoxydans]HEF8774908.1 hypothetical protein [Providencia stuartii]